MFDIEGEGFIPVERFRTILKEVDEDFTEDELDDIIFEVGLIITIITSGRQGLAGSWGKDTVRQVHYKMFSTSHFAPTVLSSNWILLFKCGYKNSLVIQNPTWDRTKP